MISSLLRLESSGIPYFFVKLLNFLSSLNEMRSLYFDALHSIVEQTWAKSRGDKVACSEARAVLYGGPFERPQETS